ncbi:MAG: hypothetical protein AB1498_08520 [bacterium]
MKIMPKTAKKAKVNYYRCVSCGSVSAKAKNCCNKPMKKQKNAGVNNWF